MAHGGAVEGRAGPHWHPVSPVTRQRGRPQPRRGWCATPVTPPVSTADTAAPAAKVTYRDVFAVREYRALWLAQLVSMAGDQFARIALAVLVYDRTRSPLLAAVTWTVTAVANVAGGVLLGWVADRWPRRRVMLTCDVICVALVAVMAIPGIPLAVLVAMLFAVSLAFPPFQAARAAVNREVLGRGQRFQFGMAVTVSTYQIGQLVGLATGGVVAGLAGPRAALLADAATFGLSALVIWAAVKPRPVNPEPKVSLLTGVRVVFAIPVARTAMLLFWLAAFYDGPEGVTVPLGRQLGGGAATAGWLLAAMMAGAASGELVCTKLIATGWRMRTAAVMAAAACAVLLLFAGSPPLAAALVILAVSGVCTGYFAPADDALYGAVAPEHHGKVTGVINSGMALGQAAVMLVAGAVAERVSPAVAVAGCGAAGTVAAVPLLLAWRRVRP